jgi:uncharacterized membrane protein
MSCEAIALIEIGMLIIVSGVMITTFGMFRQIQKKKRLQSKNE